MYINSTCVGNYRILLMFQPPTLYSIRYTSDEYNSSQQNIIPESDHICKVFCLVELRQIDWSVRLVAIDGYSYDLSFHI